MSGYLEGLLVLLAINTVFAYGAYLPLAAGQLNIGLAGFAAIGAYGSAYLSNRFAVDPLIAIPLGAILSVSIRLHPRPPATASPRSGRWRRASRTSSLVSSVVSANSMSSTPSISSLRTPPRASFILPSLSPLPSA